MTAINGLVGHEAAVDPVTGKLAIDTEAISIHIGTSISVNACHGPDWFPLNIESGLHSTTLYLRRAQLRALRVQLDLIDARMPDPSEGQA